MAYSYRTPHERHRNERPKPCGKRKLSRGKAAMVVENARRSTSEHRNEKRVYFCEGCGAWHTSSREEYPMRRAEE